jgi:hypothetical protein
MNKLYCIFSILVIICGCATGNISLSQKEFDKLRSMKLVRYETSKLQIHTGSTMVAGGLLFGGFGMEALGREKGKELTEKCSLPDFSKLTIEMFVNKVSNEIKDWPSMTVEENPVEDDYVSQTDHLMTFKTGMLWLYSFGAMKGLNTLVEAKITTPSGERVWRQTYFYQQKKFGEVPDIEVFEAENCRVLKEQLNFAANQTASEFIKDLKKGLTH